MRRGYGASVRRACIAVHRMPQIAGIELFCEGGPKCRNSLCTASAPRCTFRKASIIYHSCQILWTLGAQSSTRYQNDIQIFFF
eukprot:COSAG01_NODE_508_length_16107_cov_120.001187_19_plen_83_part_00